MGKNVDHIQHIKSNVVLETGKPKLPQPSALVEGELAINYAEGVETISIKNSSGDVVTFSSDNYYTEQKLGSGFTGENSGVTVTEALENVEITVDQDFSNTASTNPISTKAVYSATTENELVWTNAYVALSGAVSAHTENTDIHVTAADKARWNSSSDSLWESGTGQNAVAQKGGNNTASGNYSYAEGRGTKASGDYSHAEGYNTVASGDYSHAEGDYTSAMTYYSHAEGSSTKANGKYSHAEGFFTIANNESEHASGQYNVSSSASTTFGDSGNTLFSVGNGSNITRHNAFEIRQNGDIYIVSGNSDIKLQDYIGSVETVTAITPSNSGSTEPIATKVVAENELTVTNALTDLDERKLDASAYTPTDLSNYYTKSETSGATELATAFSGKLDATAYTPTDLSNYYTKSETSGATELVTAFSTKANTATTLAGYGITDAYTKSETSGATEISNALTDLSTNKADKSTTYTKSEIDDMIGDIETLLAAI